MEKYNCRISAHLASGEQRNQPEGRRRRRRHGRPEALFSDRLRKWVGELLIHNIHSLDEISTEALEQRTISPAS